MKSANVESPGSPVNCVNVLKGLLKRMIFVGPLGRAGLLEREREVRREFGFETGVFAFLFGVVLNVIKYCQSGQVTNETSVLYME